jgi:hypothetical protein
MADPKPHEVTLHDLYPHLTDGQLKEAEENIERYLEVVARTFERLLKDPQAYAKFKVLTASAQPPTIQDTQSIPPPSSSPS